MNKILLFLFILSALICLILLGFLFGWQIYQNRGRKLIYPSTSRITLYPGSGKITEAVDGQIFVLPKGIGKPFFDSPENKLKYSEDVYEVIDIPAQDQLMYVVGIFEDWEDIKGSADKYMLVSDPSSKIIERFRVSFAPVLPA